MAPELQKVHFVWGNSHKCEIVHFEK